MEADGAVATYQVNLAGVRFQIVGAQMALPNSAGGPDGSAGNGLYGVRVRGATFEYANVGAGGVIPLPGALIPALTGLTARRRRRKAA